MNSQTWPCGIPKSQGNAFDLSAILIPIKPLTKAERQKAYQRKSAAKIRMTAKQRAAEILLQKPQNFHISPTPQADRDRSNVIAGRRMESRSQ